MKILRIYLDTSVIGGCYDSEFQFESLKLIQKIKEGNYICLFSEVTLKELEQAPDKVKKIIMDLPSPQLEFIKLNTSMIELRNAYLEANIVSPKSTDDATHVAIATISMADAIVSWNFKHIVQLDKMKMYNQINLLNGYGILTIVSPREIINYE
jgi:predicted nucleic acid-binding protein